MRYPSLSVQLLLQKSEVDGSVTKGTMFYLGQISFTPSQVIYHTFLVENDKADQDYKLYSFISDKNNWIFTNHKFYWFNVNEKEIKSFIWWMQSLSTQSLWVKLPVFNSISLQKESLFTLNKSKTKQFY